MIKNKTKIILSLLFLTAFLSPSPSYAATSYKFTDSSGKTIKASDGTKYTYMGCSKSGFNDETGEPDIIKSGKTVSFWFKGPQTDENNRYYIQLWSYMSCDFENFRERTVLPNSNLQYAQLVHAHYYGGAFVDDHWQQWNTAITVKPAVDSKAFPCLPDGSKFRWILDGDNSYILQEAANGDNLRVFKRAEAINQSNIDESTWIYKAVPNSTVKYSGDASITFAEFLDINNSQAQLHLEKGYIYCTTTPDIGMDSKVAVTVNNSAAVENYLFCKYGFKNFTGERTEGDCSNGIYKAATPPKVNWNSTIFGGSCANVDSPMACWVGKVLSWASGLLGFLAVLMVVLGGFMYMTSGGNEDRIALSKQLIFGALAGIGLIILSTVLFKFMGVSWLGQ